MRDCIEVRTVRSPLAECTFPKADGRQRPLGIASLEDKLVQRAVAEVHERHLRRRLPRLLVRLPPADAASIKRWMRSRSE